MRKFCILQVNRNCCGQKNSKNIHFLPSTIRLCSKSTMECNSKEKLFLGQVSSWPNYASTSFSLEKQVENCFFYQWCWAELTFCSIIWCCLRAVSKANFDRNTSNALTIERLWRRSRWKLFCKYCKNKTQIQKKPNEFSMQKTIFYDKTLNG